MLNYLSSLCSKSFCGFSTQLGRVFSLSKLEPGAKMEGRKILEMNRKPMKMLATQAVSLAVLFVSSIK